jgi:hypothetical protein
MAERFGPGGLAAIVAALPLSLHAATIELPLPLDYRIVSQALARQVFTDPGGTAEVFADSIRCNTLVLSEPRVGGGGEGRLQLVTNMQANVGTPVGGKCLFSKAWEGVVVTEQTANVEPGVPVIEFRVVESNLLRAEDGKSALPRFMRRWIQDYAHPLLGGVTIDLGPAVSGIEELLDLALALDPQSVTLNAVDARPEVLVAMLNLEVADAPVNWVPPAQPPLSDAELAAWDANWQAWDAYATWMIKTLAFSTDPELTRALAETLLVARYELRDALVSDEPSTDAVRELFLSTWARLVPLLQDSDLPIPGGEALTFAGFISAGNALLTLDQLAPHLGIAINQDALRNMARMLEPTVSEVELSYNTDVDQELRALLGLGPVLEVSPPPSSRRRPIIFGLLDWLVSDAHASQIDPELVQRLNTWVPRRPEIDSYLETMAQLLDEIAAAEQTSGKIPERFLPIYDPLLRATAWQESCWRQYVDRGGEIEPIRSSAGSVGLMQINVHVWRGVYDVDLIQNNVGYNARAGNEILVHYLVDYAIRKNEHEVTGDDDNLARAAYAIYNGGPSHMKRYRQDSTSASLKKIDKAFWEKYQAIQEYGPLAVKPCLAGG